MDLVGAGRGIRASASIVAAGSGVGRHEVSSHHRAPDGVSRRGLCRRPSGQSQDMARGIMNVEFSCYDCGQKYSAPRQMSGTVLSCHRCGWPMKVPRRDPRPAPRPKLRENAMAQTNGG